MSTSVASWDSLLSPVSGGRNRKTGFSPIRWTVDSEKPFGCWFSSPRTVCCVAVYSENKPV